MHLAAAMDDRPSVEQAAPRQVVSVERLAHVPPLAQDPVFPHAPVAAGGQLDVSVVPAASAVHVPGDVLTLQAWQAVSHAVSQHTPSTQLAAVLTQSVATLHMAPFACCVPHLWVTVLQRTLTQSLSALQVVPHWVALRHL